MTYAEYKKKRLASTSNTTTNVQANTNSNITTSSYAEYKKQRLTQQQDYLKTLEKETKQAQLAKDFISQNGTEKINSEYNNYMQSMNKAIAPKLYQTEGMQELASKKNATTPLEVSVYAKGNPVTQSILKLQNFAKENGIEIDVNDPVTSLTNQTNKLDDAKKEELMKYIYTYNKVRQENLKNKNYTADLLSRLNNGKNIVDSPNVIQSSIGRAMGQQPSDRGKLLKVPENMKDNLRRFKDGYQFGDITATALENFGDSATTLGSTALEIPTRIVKGVFGVSEGMANAGASVIAGAADLIGQDEYANALRKRIAVGTPFVKTHNLLESTADKLDTNSFSGKLLDSATEGVGQSGGQIAVGAALGKFGEVPIKFGEHVLNMPTTAFATGMGSAATETYAKADEQLGGLENATGKEKLQMALRILGGGTIEGTTEGLFGLLGVGGTDITDEFAKKAVARAGNAFQKQLTKITIAGGGEAAEEFISYASNYLLDNYANKFGQLDFSENWNWDDVMQEMASAFISSGISQGVTSAVQINKATQNAIQLAEREQGRQLTTQEMSEIRNSVANEVFGAREELENAQNSTNINKNTPNSEQISQNNVQNVSNLQNTIQNDTERFSQEVEEWKNNNWNNKKHLTVLQNTPQLYLDMGLNDLPITVTANKLDRIFNAEGNQKSTYHNLQDLVKELPRAISNPLNIVESSTRDGGIVVVTDLSDSNNDIVVVSLAPDGQGRLEVDDVITTKSANVMTSAYDRRNYDYNVDNQGNYYDGWMEENLKNNRIIYDIDEGIIKKRINGQWLELPNDTDSSNTSVKRLQLPNDTEISDVSSTTNTPINNIIRPAQNYVNNSQENFAFPTNEQLQAMDNKRISESADVLNLRDNGKTEKTYKTNIERDSSIVEQKIKAIEKGKAKRDENAKRVSKEDIRKTIENYTNQEMLTKHFREKAYGIYKPSTNTIRLAQRSDVETAIHELGHQIDIKQLNNLSQKTNAEVQTELKKICDTSFPNAYKKVSTKLQEGFAEATKMYIEDNENFVKTYPNTANLIQNELNSDKKLAKVFSTLTEQFHDYINMTPGDRILSHVSFEGEDTKPKLDWKYLRDKAIEWIWDDQIALKRLTENVAKSKNIKVEDLTPSENITMTLKLAEGLEDATLSSLRNGYEENGAKQTKGFSEILKDFGHNDIENLVAYMVSEGNLDYIKANKQTGIRESDAQAMLKKYKDTKISKASEEIREINDYSLKRLLQSGLITEEQVKSFKKVNEHYVPMNRVIDRDGKIGLNTKGLQNGKVIKGRKGSDRMIINPLESTVVNNMRIDRQIANNENLKNLVDTLKKNDLLGEYIDEIPTPMQFKGSVELEVFAKELEKQGVDTSDLDLQAVYNIFTPKLSDDKNLIMSYMENGERKYIQFKDKSLYAVINGLTDQKGLSTLEKFYSYFNNALRWGATAGNIDFSLPNVISDSQTAFLNSDATFIPIVDSIIGIADTAAGNTADHPILSKFIKKIAPDYRERKTRLYELYEKSGAKNTINRTGLKNRKNNLENVLGALAVDEKTLLGESKKRPLKAIKKATEWAPALSEEGTRFRNFEKELKQYEKQGMRLEDAVKKAGYNAVRVTQDFSQSGKATRVMNNVKPFTSAKISGTYQAYENFAKNPKRYSTRVAILTATSATIHALVIQALKNGIGDEEEYKELQDQKRLDNYTLPIGDGKTITIKKIQGPIRIIINLTETAVDYSMGMLDDKGLDKRIKAIANDAYMDNSYLSNATDVAGQFGTPILENALNKDFYYGNDLIPENMKYLDNANKYDENTTETAKLIGKALDYPPIYIDNLVEGYLAGVGTQAMQVSDWVINKVTGKKTAKRQASESFITKRFIADDYKNSQSVNEIYDIYDDLKNDETEGRLTEEQKKQLENIEQAKDTMAIINKKIRETKTDNAINSKEKAEKIRELQKQRTDTARYYLGKGTIAKENKEQIELYEYYPTATSKISSIIDEEGKNEYAQIVKDTYAFNLKSLKDDKEYIQANEEGKNSMEKTALTQAKNTAKEKMIQNNLEELVEEHGEEETATLILSAEQLKQYEKVEKADIPLVDFYNAWLAQKNAEGKKNAKGETISGTLKKAKIKAIQEATDLTTEQNKVLYGIFNIGK